ncbi:LOW QUALITY PROTEIN: lysine-specific demethylase 2B-like, partial [Pollicipes pollicipes]|uniref:LOW QUALITY PROTEIN: lysine-specific demethylase 2B-like n=1 Tax=Pollicipes pollicipes TaxID=41117 RepID=UPI001885A0B9
MAGGSGDEDGDSPKKARKTRRIKTREKDRKIYTDDWNLAEEELEGQRSFDLDQKIASDNFPQCFVKEMEGKDFDLAWIQVNGFSTPLVFHSKDHLGINVPPSSFTINDVRLAVGSRRMLDVMDVRTQKNMEMTMKEWQQYFENPAKDRLLNVISLEFSHTKLERLVDAPTVVRQIDWVDRVWPRHLKELQTESTNVLDDMMYPKVQKYCLMSVNGCYTDFHIDFGGTSVWYHVLKGGKVFWLIPPSDQNVQLYENWVLSGKQGDVFFGDTVEQCGRIELKPGDTFFIPTGWIHAVYTPADSLVFGGNFLHSFAVDKQLKIAKVEDATRVQQKYRYPFFTEMLWYVLERYVHCLLGRSHLVLGLDELSERAPPPPRPAAPHVHLTPFELHGLKAIVLYLHGQPASRKCVPELIRDPIALIGDVRLLVERHRFDCPKLAVTGQPALQWPDNGQELRLMLQGYVKTAEEELDPDASPRKGPRGPRTPGAATPLARRVLKGKKGDRRRRVRCKECDGCTRDECRECACCRDMPKFGGPGIIKQSCKMRVCQKRPEKSTLYECRSCFRIAHIACTMRQLSTETEGRVLPGLPNCWSCPECVDLGLEEAPPRKPGRPPGRPKKVRLDEPVGVPASQAVPDQERLWLPPGPLQNRELLVAVFRWLAPADLAACLLVCRAWSAAALDRRLWTRLSAGHRRLTERTLVSVMRRQPAELDLAWAQLGAAQLGWLVSRLAHLRHLSLQGVPFAAVAGLRTPCCPLLLSLDLSHVEGLTDSRLRELLAPPAEARPGATDASSRLRALRRLSVAGTDVSDAGCRCLAQQLPRLARLDLSGCARLSSAGLAALVAADAPLRRTLAWLDISGCRGVTEAALAHLRQCAALR